MIHLVPIAGAFLGTVAAAGIAQTLAGVAVLRRFTSAPVPRPAARPPITVLKPLHGDEPLLEAALESLFVQDYPGFQIVFGVQSPTDPALAVVRRLRDRYPGQEVAVVIDGARHGPNHKIDNLINMLGAARHDILVLADSDVHAAPDYLDRLVAEFERPGTGAVTTLYAGLAASPGLAGVLGASHISHTFLPGALLARALGREDCLGATMAVKRETLAAIGGFAALVDHLADDAVLGQLVRARGLRVRLAATVPLTTVPEADFEALGDHELRWARTIRSLAPIGHAASLLQFPIVWALLAVCVTGAAPWALALCALAWLTRACAAAHINHRLRLPTAAPRWSMMLRDLASVGLILASFSGAKVRWRGQEVPLGRPLYLLRHQARAQYRAAEHV